MKGRVMRCRTELWTSIVLVTSDPFYDDVNDTMRVEARLLVLEEMALSGGLPAIVKPRAAYLEPVE